MSRPSQSSVPHSRHACYFVEVLLAVKQTEHDAYQQVISSWEREHLLLNV